MIMTSGVIQLQTGVDKLIALVNEKEEVSLTEAAKQINIPKSTIETWCGSLQAKGLITTRFTFNECFLMSNDYYNYKFNFLNSVSQNLKSLNSRKPVHYESALEKREQEIKLKLNSLDGKMKELKKYEELKLLANERINSLKHMEKEFDAKENLLAKEKKEIMSERFELAKRRERHLQEMVYLNNKIKAFGIKKTILKEKEKQIKKTSKNLNVELKAFEKQKKRFDKRKEKLAKQDLVFVAKLRDKIIKANNYLDKPMFTDAQFEMLLKKIDSMKENLN